jgi:hypothetical protein
LASCRNISNPEAQEAVLIRPALLALAAAALMAVSARAQTPPVSIDHRLDRIENKLDEILHRLNAPSPPGVSQAAPSLAPAAPAVPNAAQASYQPGRRRHRPCRSRLAARLAGHPRRQRRRLRL